MNINTTDYPAPPDLTIQAIKVLKSWTYLHVASDYDLFVMEFVDKLRKNGHLGLYAENVREIVASHEAWINKLDRAYLIGELSLFNRRFLEEFFENVRNANYQLKKPEHSGPEFDGPRAFLERLFPLYALCIDYDYVKELNAIFGNNYPRANPILRTCNDILHETARIHQPTPLDAERRALAGEYVLPDMAFQFQSGDEVVLLLPQAKSISDAVLVGARFEENLSALGDSVVHPEGFVVHWTPSMTFACCEIPTLEANPGKIVSEAFTQIHERKLMKRRPLSLAA